MTDMGHDCCQKAELAAYVRTNGSMELGTGGIKIRFDIKSLGTAKRICGIIKSQYNMDADIMEKQDKRFGRVSTYSIRVEDADAAKQMLTDTGVLLTDDEHYDIETKLPKGCLRKTCCQKAYLKGTFLGSGSITDPKKEYRLEFASRDEDTDKHIRMLLHSMDVKYHTAMRKSWYVIYITNSSNIVKVLAMLGAHKHLLDMENVIVLKELRNDVNRRVNIETANLSKVIDAAQKQIKAIEILKKHEAYDMLPKSVKAIAELRMDNKEATLTDMAELMDISKSAVNHRLRKLIKFAKDYEQSNIFEYE